MLKPTRAVVVKQSDSSHYEFYYRMKIGVVCLCISVTEEGKIYDIFVIFEGEILWSCEPKTGTSGGWNHAIYSAGRRLGLKAEVLW